MNVVPFFYKNDTGEEFGPFHPAQLDAWLSQGHLQQSLLVRAADEPEGAFVSISARGEDPFRICALKSQSLTSSDMTESKERSSRYASSDLEDAALNDCFYDDEDDADVVAQTAPLSNKDKTDKRRIVTSDDLLLANQHTNKKEKEKNPEKNLSVDALEGSVLNDVRLWVTKQGWQNLDTVDEIIKRVFNATKYPLEGSPLGMGLRDERPLSDNSDDSKGGGRNVYGVGAAPKKGEVAAAAAALSLVAIEEAKEAEKIKLWEHPDVQLWMKQNSIETLSAQTIGFCRTYVCFHHQFFLSKYFLIDNFVVPNEFLTTKNIFFTIHEDIEQFLSSPPSPPTQLMPNLYIGHEGNARDIEWLTKNEISGIINLAPDDISISVHLYDSVNSPGILCTTGNVLNDIDISKESNEKYQKNVSNIEVASGGLEYLSISLSNDEDFDILPYFKYAHNFLDRHLHRGHSVLLYCYDGISVTPTVAMSYIMLKLHSNVLSVAAYAWRKRKVIEPNLSQLAALIRYEKILSEKRLGQNMKSPNLNSKSNIEKDTSNSSI